MERQWCFQGVHSIFEWGGALGVDCRSNGFLHSPFVDVDTNISISIYIYIYIYIFLQKNR